MEIFQTLVLPEQLLRHLELVDQLIRVPLLAFELQGFVVDGRRTQRFLAIMLLVRCGDSLSFFVLWLLNRHVNDEIGVVEHFDERLVV